MRDLKNCLISWYRRMKAVYVSTLKQTLCILTKPQSLSDQKKPDLCRAFPSVAALGEVYYLAPNKIATLGYLKFQFWAAW